LGTEVVGRVKLVPAKGLLGDLLETVRSKFSGNGSFRFVTRRLSIPPAKFSVELVVDDDCGVCPYAVEAVSELASLHSNVEVVVYNASYVKPPFQVNATPAFRINGKVMFTGIPLSPEGVQKAFSKYLREAYILTHPKLKWLTDRLEMFAKAHGYARNPNIRAYKNLIYKLLLNIDKYGKPYCPCRPQKDETTICPCSYCHIEIKQHGHCLCGLMWSREKVEEYIKNRLRKYGWIITEIGEVQKQLEELKKRVVMGEAKEFAAKVITKLQEIYVTLPD